MNDEAKKAAQRAREKAWRESHPEEYREKKRRYYLANRDKIRAKHSTYYERTKDVAKARAKARYEANKPRIKAQNTKWREANREQTRACSRKHRWREQGIEITNEQYQALLVAQSHRCALCESEFVIGNGRHKRAPNVDHCHITGRIRAVLCKTCNRHLGLVEKMMRALTPNRLTEYLGIPAV